MKKILMAAVMLLLTANSFALMGIGGHFGYDLMDIAKEKKDFKISVGGKEFNYDITRDEIVNPMSAGIQLYFDMPLLPIGLEAGFSGSWAKYNWSAPKQMTLAGSTPIDITIPGYAGGTEGYSEEFNFVRMTADVTAKYYFFGFPPVVKIVDFYVGGGVGLYMITPLVSEELFKKELAKLDPSKTTATVDVEELVKKNSTVGGHFVVGAKIKPPVIPLSINLDYKYNMTPENDYKDKTNNFSTIKASLNFYI